MIPCTIALLCALGQAPPAREEASGFRFAKPDGWSMRIDESSGGTYLTPPGAVAEAEIILFPTNTGDGAGALAFHDAMFRAIAQGSTVKGATETGRTGAFQWTRAKISPAAGGEIRLAVYTSASPTRHGAALFRAASAKAFDTYLPAAERLVRELRFADAAAPTAAAAPTTIHGLRLALPAGWTRKDEPSGLVLLYPPPPRGPLEAVWDYVLVVLPSQPLRGTFWETHRAIFGDLVKTSGIVDPVPPTWRPDAPGPFIKATTAGRDAAGNMRNLALYSALSAGGIECIIVHNQEDLEGVGSLLGGATVKDPPPLAARLKIAEAYRRIDRKVFIDAGGGAPIPGSLQYQRIWLRADGVADFSTIYLEGYAASPVPAKLDPKLLNGDVGSWKAVGNEVHIVRTAGTPPEVYLREGGALRRGGETWQPMPSVDGMVLDGRWGLRSARGDGPADLAWIEFTPQGRFRDEGVLAHAGALAVYRYPGSREVLFPRPPPRGAGTYEIRDFTLFVRYDDGTAWSTDFSTVGTDAKDRSAILLRTHVFSKQP